LIAQDIRQVVDAYGQNESIVSNCHVRIAYAPNQIDTAELLSKMTGTTTVQKASFNFSGSRFSPVMGSDGKQQTHANWHSLVFYGEVADIAMSFEKDDNIYVEGSLQQRKFTPADGVTRSIYEVHARSCHKIADSRVERQDGTSEPSAAEIGDNRDDPSWPVGPA
jgi:single-stranded DNA-binding protein